MGFTDKLKKQIHEENAEQESVSLGDTEFKETFESSPFFGVENVRNAPACIDLRLKNNTFKSIPYSFILEINYNPSDGIEVITTTKKIIITGRNLRLLYRYLGSFQVKYIQANYGHDITEEKSLFVNEIKINDID